jgi:hypothetical protein
VFLWGLQYKLSLYDPPQAASHHQVPIAKLLSKNELSSTENDSTLDQLSHAIKAVHPAPPAALFLLLAVCFFSVTIAIWRILVDHPPLELKQALLETFFVRPPPTLA